MSKMINIGRLRPYPYKVNFDGNGLRQQYVWSGSKGKVVDVKPVPEEVVNYLMISTNCFKNGSLKIMEDEDSKAVVDNIDDKEEYEVNTHTRQDIEKILTGNINKMKSELKKITNDQEKSFVCDVAKEINLDSASKRQFLSEWIGIEEEFLFPKED